MTAVGTRYLSLFIQVQASRVKIYKSSRDGLTPTPTCLPGQGGSANAGCGLKGNQAGNSPLDEGFFHGLVSHN